MLLSLLWLGPCLRSLLPSVGKVPSPPLAACGSKAPPPHCHLCLPQPGHRERLGEGHLTQVTHAGAPFPLIWWAGGLVLVAT